MSDNLSHRSVSYLLKLLFTQTNVPSVFDGSVMSVSTQTAMKEQQQLKTFSCFKRLVTFSSKKKKCKERPCDSVIKGLFVMVFCMMEIFYTRYVEAEGMARLYMNQLLLCFLKCDHI